VEQLEGEFRPVLGRFRNPRSVYTEARAIAADARSRDSLKREMRHRDWDDIEDLLGRLLGTLPPVCFYLDSVDEQFGTAPNYWLQCQLGLSRQVLELLRDVRFGGRLRVVVAIRDLVRSSLLQGESGTRFARTGHIRVLDWDHASIRRFLREKIHRLPPRYRMSTEGDDVRAWLGVDELHNHRRGMTEELESYLLRHTRLIPRDIVQLGNELSVAVVAAKAHGASGLQPQTIRTAVAKVAKEFADEQIAVCGNHLASDTIPMDAGRQGFAEFYTSGLYAESVHDELCHFIAEVGTDRFAMADLKRALEATGGNVMSVHPDPLNVLWQNGLLGYDPPEDDLHHSHFYGAEDVADFRLPDRFDSYVFHPIVAHRVWIEPAGRYPVTGFRTHTLSEH
jgi:hypothetical protein